MCKQKTVSMIQLKAAISLDSAERKMGQDFDVMTDVDILKAFNLPLDISDTEIYEGSYVSRLLRNREERPSRMVWDFYNNLAKSNDLQPADAAELYFHIKDKYPIRDERLPDEDGQPAMSISPMEGFGLMMEGKGGEDDEDCD